MGKFDVVMKGKRRGEVVMSCGKTGSFVWNMQMGIEDREYEDGGTVQVEQHCVVQMKFEEDVKHCENEMLELFEPFKIDMNLHVLSSLNRVLHKRKEEPWGWHYTWNYCMPGALEALIATFLKCFWKGRRLAWISGNFKKAHTWEWFSLT